jgi:hypothetical protein
MNHRVDIPNFDETYILRGGHVHHHPDHFTKDHYFRVEVFRATLDTQLNELNLKFNENVMDLLSISVTLVPKNGFTSFRATDVCNMVEKYYPTDFIQQERIGLEYQLNHFVAEVSNSKDLKNIAILIELCRCLVYTGCHMVFILIDRLLHLPVTLLVSTASAKRAFFIKTRLIRWKRLSC